MDPVELPDVEPVRRRRRRRLRNLIGAEGRAARRVRRRAEPGALEQAPVRRRVRRPGASEPTAQVSTPERRTRGGVRGRLRRAGNRLRRGAANLIRGRRSTRRT